MKKKGLNRKTIAACLLLAFVATSLATGRSSASYFHALNPIPVPQPTPPPTEEMDEEGVAAFTEELNEVVKNVLNDYFDIDGVNTTFERISNKVGERESTGTTKQQIVRAYLADIKAVVTKPEIVKAMEGALAVLLGQGRDPVAAPTGGNTSEEDAPPAQPPTRPTNRTTEPAQTNESASPSTDASLKQYIKGLRYDARRLLAVQGDGGTMIVDKEKDKKNERKMGNAKVIRCLRTSRSLSKNFEDVAILQPTQGVIYPGALIYADQELVDGKPRPLSELARAPINLRVDLPGLEDEGSFTVANPSDGKVQSGLNKALNFWNDSANYTAGYVNPSRSNYSSTVAYSSEQLAMSLGFNAKWTSGDASAQFKFTTSNKKNVVVAVYRQVFYTLTFDAPNSPEQFFDSSVTVDQVREALTTESPSAPGYVSSVNYGRIIMFRMETDKSTTAVDAQAAFNYAAGEDSSVGGDVKVKYDKILSNSSITVVTLGGNAENASQSVSAKGPTEIQNIIKGKNAVYSKNNPGVPITYTVKFLKDNTIAKMGSTTDFTTEDCTELDNIWVKVTHDGGYIGYFSATWEEPDPADIEKFVTKERKEDGKTAGWQAKFDFPGDASNIRLKLENDTGIVWQPRREIFNRVLLPVDLNRCYTVTGTTLNSTYSSKSMGEGCP